MDVYIIRTEDCPEELAEKIMLLVEKVVGCFNTNYDKDTLLKLTVPLNGDLEVFFNVMQEFREENKIPKEDFLLLLTQTKSSQNKYFAHDRDNNIYLHTGDGTSSEYWSEEYFDSYFKVIKAVFKETKPTTKSGKRPKPRNPYQPGPGINPKPKSSLLFLPGDLNIND